MQLLLPRYCGHCAARPARTSARAAMRRTRNAEWNVARTRPRVQSLPMNAQPTESQESMRIRADVHLEIANDFRRYPACAKLRPRKALVIQHQRRRSAATWM